MRRGKTLLALVALMACTLSQSAVAGPYSDELSKCLASASTQQDRESLVEWTFLALSLGAKVEPFVNVSEEDRDRADRTMADLMVRLMTRDCLPQARATMKYEGTAALQKAFKFLGEVAMVDILSDPKVTAGATRFVQYIDEDRMKTAFEEPGK
jgi:hypothetical protein